MPELPEVETIKRELQKSVLGKKIVRVVVNDARVIRQPAAGAFAERLRGLSFTRADRRGKMIVLGISDGKFLTVHLKMTGQLVYPGTGEKSRVRFLFDDSSSLDFNDARIFAELRIVDDIAELKFLRELGPDPFDLSEERFSAMLAGRSTKIKPLLMDQCFIAGIGNLYAAEILFRSGIDPRRPAKSLSRVEKKRLFKEMTAVLEEAIRYKGSSVDNYVRLSGAPGEYVPQHRVYGREGKPCRGCRGTIKRIALGGRGTYFCPACQK